MTDRDDRTDGTAQTDADADTARGSVDHDASEPVATDGRPDRDADLVRAYTVRLELVDEPGELLNALRPIADNGGNLLSIFHERGNVTPRGQIPVEVDLEATPARFDAIVDALRAAGVNVVQAGADRYSERLTVLLVGPLLETDLSDTVARIEACEAATVADVALDVPDGGGTDGPTSARFRLATETGETAAVLEAVRAVASEKDLAVIEPLAGGDR